MTTRFRTFLASVLLLLLTIPGAAFAAEDKTCDAAIRSQMDQQGWLEAQREMEIAQRLILKPDSVLEYTCFKQEAENWGKADNAGNWPGGDPESRAWNFTNYGGGASPPDIMSAVNGLTLGALDSYLSNFGHLFLGGTYRDIGGQFLTDLNQPAAICNPQFWVWSLARCVNAAAQKDADGHLGYFFPLSKLSGRDVRDMPQSCPDPYKSERNTQVEAFQKMQNDYPDPAKNPPAGLDNASYTTGKKAGGKLYSTLLTTCGDPVKTGFKVQPLSESSDIREDAVCITPGCTYRDMRCQ